jgi:arabinogalactan oligomer/maltooligosaccharide transport system permease protein
MWAFFATFSNYFLGMIVAIMINKKGIKFKKLWRTILVITIAVPQVVSLLLMSQMLKDEGIINYLLREWGLIEGFIPFLTEETWARTMVIVVNIWIGIPYTMLICTGLLMNIPADLYESARIDGAGPVKAYMRITLPYMLHVTTPYLISQFIGNINNFNVIFLLTGGNPGTLDYEFAGKTDLLITWLYKLTFERQNYKLAAVISILTFIVVAVTSLIVYNRSSSVKNEEEFM